MYPARRRLYDSKASFETAVRSHLLAPLFYGADNGFIRKAEFLEYWNLDFRFEFSIWISDWSFCFWTCDFTT